MANLRVIAINVVDSSTIKAKFSEKLDLLNKENVHIVSNTSGVSDSKVLSVSIEKNILVIKVSPLVPYAAYVITFKSTNYFKFKSINGSYLFEDGNTNAQIILGAEEPENQIRDDLLYYQKDNLYDLESGLIRDVINSQAQILSQAKHDIGSLKNDNYLSVTIIDEHKIRGAGPYDRLNEENAYEIIKVGRNNNNLLTSAVTFFDQFPSTPVTLQSVLVQREKLEAGSGESTFDGLILTTKNKFVSKLKSVEIVYQNNDTYSYDVSIFGYHIKESKYSLYGKLLLSLDDNQFKLSDNVLHTSFVLPAAGDVIYVTYEYRNLGMVTEETSVQVSQVNSSIRELVPPLKNQFFLKNAPVVTAYDSVASTEGISFLDPRANPPFSDIHPAFSKEIPFRLEALPQVSGEYAIDYELGSVYVYGENTNDGTGYYPPVATYNYRKTFVPKLDYTYDASLQEIVANPLRDLIGQNIKISFSYEQVLVPEVDYRPLIHTEVIDERIENKLSALNLLLTKNYPITNVFRIFNETTGEIYKVSRWNGDHVYFSYVTPPNILTQQRERASFAFVNNEILIVSLEDRTNLNIRYFKINLLNNRIMAASEDVIGCKYNTSAFFSKNNIFRNELYFDSQSQALEQNINRLMPNTYLIDYQNGIIYVGVEEQQNFDLGTISYKKNVIVTLYPHLIGINNIYHSLNVVAGINKQLSFSTFGEGTIYPTSFDVADERFTNGNSALPYIVNDSMIVVSDDIKEIRGIYDHYDLINNEQPVNFSESATVTANKIFLNSGVTKSIITSVSNNHTITLPFISPGVEVSNIVSAVRIEDGVEVWNNGNINAYTISLNANPGDVVNVVYQLQLNGAATPIVDYDRGEYFIDYVFLADEILISYEYGDNSLDFRDGTALKQGDEYFVTYKVGALREALLKNFGHLVNLPILNTSDLSLPRENYRDALSGALQSFAKGPTIPALKSLVSHISHIEPELIESIFENWSLGISHLFPTKIQSSKDILLVNGKYDYGVLINNPNQTITFPVINNLRLEEGTLEMWVIPTWNGLDNDAILTFSLYKDGSIISPEEVYIGANSRHPSYDKDNSFKISKQDYDNSIGLPSLIHTRTGIFIFYDEDAKRWKVYAKNSVEQSTHYEGTIISSGEFYDAKFIPGLGEATDILRSGTSKIEFSFHLDSQDELYPDGYVDGYSTIDGYFPQDGYQSGYSYDGITFMADNKHYLFDFGQTSTSSRFSLFKDGRGYLSFHVYDSSDKNRRYEVTADISRWVAGEPHHIAVSWRINSSDHRDNLHLFIDGKEVPNIMRFGSRPASSASDRFRTVKPEYIIGTLPKNILNKSDLIINFNSNVVIATSTSFDNVVSSGDTITILEYGGSSYSVVAVNGNTLTLNEPLSINIPDGTGKYCINQYPIIVSNEIDLFQNIAVYLISDGEERELPGLRAQTPGYSLGRNALNQNVLTILGDAFAGDQVAIRTLGLNHRRYRDKQYVWGNTQNILRSQLPTPIHLDAVNITAVLLPWTAIGPQTGTWEDEHWSSILTTSEVSNSVEGRTLSVTINGENVKFSPHPVNVTIYGNTNTIETSENLVFVNAGTKITVNKFKAITNIIVEVYPVVQNKNSISIQIKEAYPITYSDGNDVYPVIRYSYKNKIGSSLNGDIGTSIVIDANTIFEQSLTNQLLVINAPLEARESYQIIDVIDEHTLSVNPPLAASFSNASYDIFNISIGRGGFQNGFLTFEEAGTSGTPFCLKQGYYDFDLSTYLEIPFVVSSDTIAYIGSDMFQSNQANCVIDEFRILSKCLTDIRIGETTTNKESITTDFTSLLPHNPNYDTLMLLHFDELPLTNTANVWKRANKEFMQAGTSVNGNFGHSLIVIDKPLVVDNKGLFSTSIEGTIEFWVSPRFDTYNDPQNRFYFDATGSLVEENTSITNGKIKLNSRASKILSVRLLTDTNNSGVDYFAGGTLESDFQTLKLQKSLPFQKTPVKVNYIPSGLLGNRISIFKDKQGFIVFNVLTKDNEFEIRQPIFWAKDSWHRIQATYKFNSSNNKDELKLLIDGEEQGSATFGNFMFGQGVTFGQSSTNSSQNSLVADINFYDPINEFYIGSNYLKSECANAKIDNLRLSNIARKPTMVAGQPRDLNFNTNLEMVLPVVEDVFTTYLLNFDSLITKIDDFCVLRNENFGIFDFSLNIIDSFGIVLNNPKVKQMMENLIAVLKPAQSKVSIKYIK